MRLPMIETTPPPYADRVLPRSGRRPLPVPTTSRWRSVTVNPYLYAVLGLLMILGTVQVVKAMGHWATIKAQFPEAQAVWQRIAAREFDGSLFGLPESKLTAMQTGIAAETEALVQLERALENGDTAVIIKRSVGIKPNFAALFMLFGDFETVTQI